MSDRTYQTASLKVGEHRGRKRLWIEGRKLSNAGWIAKETRYRRTFDPANQQIILQVCPNGPFRASGKATKPVLDLNGVNIAETLGNDCERVSVLFNRNLITILPEPKG